MAIDIILRLWYLSLLCCCYSFLLPEDVSEQYESFVNGEVEYIIIAYSVTWLEAKIICESIRNGSLAIINTPEIRDFLTEALAESDLEANTHWVGARKEKVVPNAWLWIGTGDLYIEDYFFINRGNETLSGSRDCLSFGRKNHYIPLYVDLDCSLRRALICEKPHDKLSYGKLTTPDWIRVGQYRYGIFYDKKTWKQAVRECRSRHRSHLASFHNAEQVAVVGKYLLIGRPSLENAWIGGHYENDYWSFVSESQPLPTETNKTTLFPPWKNGHARKERGCLLLDRHLTDHPIFVATRCDRSRSYICAMREPQEKNVAIINGVAYVIYYRKKSWDDALKQCKLIGGTLVKVTKEIILDLVILMGENLTAIQHVWIGGKLHSNLSHFYWVEDDETILPNNIDIDHYPPWFDNEYDANYACLNMDRENHNRPMFYGAACDTPQAFICEIKDVSKAPPSEPRMHDEIPDPPPDDSKAQTSINQGSTKESEKCTPEYISSTLGPD